MSLVKRHTLIAFFVLAFALSWWAWPLYYLDLSPNPIIGFGPFLAALVVLALTEGRSGVGRLLRRMVRWRVGLRWYAVALLPPIMVALAAAVLNVFVLGAERTSAAELGGLVSDPRPTTLQAGSAGKRGDGRGPGPDRGRAMASGVVRDGELSARDAYVALIKAAREHGEQIPSGVRVSISVRALALAAASKRAAFTLERVAI